jgi:cysteine desulfurase/selenocysteine lyase
MHEAMSQSKTDSSRRKSCRDPGRDEGRAHDREIRLVAPLVPPGNFPLIDRERIRGRAYLDNGATTQKPIFVIDAVRDFYLNHYANIHRGVHRLSEEATEAFETARADLGWFVGAEHPEQEIIFCKGATEAINLVAHGWGNRHVGPGDEIVLTTMEHHSNLVPWQLLCERTGARLVELKPTAEGTITAEAMEQVIGPRTRLVGMTHISNLLGTINDVKTAAGIAHRAGALLLVDGAQALGHLPVDVQEIGCDLYVGSGHKMFGPTGIGFLYGCRALLESFEPFLGGGDMIEDVHFDHSTYAALPARLEAGTPNMAGAVGWGAALAFLETVGMKKVARHDRALIDYALERLAALPWLEIYGPGNSTVRSGLISFNIQGMHAHDVASILNAEGVAVRAGHMCAKPLLRFLGKNSCVRAGFALYNDATDVELLVQGLERAARVFSVN